MRHEKPLCRTLTEIDGRFVEVDAAFCELMQMTMGDLIGRDIIDITHPQDRGDTQIDMRRLRDEGKEFSILKRYVRPDGSIVWATAHAAVVDAPLGQKYIAGRIAPSDPNPILGSRRARDFAIYEALGRLASVRKP